MGTASRTPSRRRLARSSSTDPGATVEPLNLKQYMILQAFGVIGVLLGVWWVRYMDVKALKR